jgi:hypothetical protein
MDSRWGVRTVLLSAAMGMLVGTRCLAAPGPVGGMAGAGPIVRQVSHVEYDTALEASFATAVDGNGNAVITMNTSDLTLEKVVSPTGAATLRLSRGKDLVSVAMGPRGYTVTRGKRSAAFNPAAPRETDLDSIRAVLVGSRAVRAFRELTAILEARPSDDSVMIAATLLDGAVVDMLDGDPGAVDRIAKRVAGKRRSGVQPASYSRVQFQDCVLSYELSLLYSYDLYWTCLQTAEASPWYIWYIARSMCEWEFLIRSQQYIFQFVSCAAIPM